MNAELVQLFERKNWNALERTIQEDYVYLLELSKILPTDDAETKLLAQILYGTLKHSRNKDFKQSLVYDFINFLSLQLEPNEFVEQWTLEESECFICMEAVTPSSIAIYHRLCNQVIGHSDCLRTWWKQPETVRCKCLA